MVSVSFGAKVSWPGVIVLCSQSRLPGDVTRKPAQTKTMIKGHVVVKRFEVEVCEGVGDSGCAAL